MVSVDAGQADACRAEARKRQILDAAARCYRRHGFHATSMQELAREAKMSVGHIYHYFANKEAIIAAFIEEDVEHFREIMKRLREDNLTVAEALVAHAEEAWEDVRNPENAALALEIHAEASRNPKIAEMVRCADRISSDGVFELFVTDLADRQWSPQETRARVEILFTLYEGLFMRVIRNPQIEREPALAAFRLAVDRILA
ncbi:TetR/AcrR family transcriptional regulator [Oleomonas cavernae]|uniref:TetR/AcrR family transcriptional regulator n=1 Tax=Oleomonas cavernae TaxID=2320859 RepID=A0A418VTQ1_9PROT|nr:TetR/AcrR family transcriptional regulator [Oleomonas cavernae]RJF80514.1 TetR/AcrR family transcriptional regulator [Oleomonas cavernae]